MTFTSWLYAALTLLAANTGVAAPLTLRTCIDERPWLPFTSPDRAHPGTMQLLVQEAAAELKIGVAQLALPWRRCQADVFAGQLDAMVGAAFVPYNSRSAVFPMVEMNADRRLALGTARILLVKRRGSAADWDGRRFLNLKKPVGTAAGTQVMIDAVRDHGGRVDDGAQTDERNLAKLLLNEVDLVAAYEADLKPLVDGKHHGSVTVLATPLSETDYYLAASPAFYAAHRDLLERLWAAIGRRRGK